MASSPLQMAPATLLRLSFPSHHGFPLPLPHTQEFFLCCHSTTFREDRILFKPRFIQEIYIIQVLSPSTAVNSQASRYTATWLCPWFTDFRRVFIHLKHSCFAFKLSPHWWNICSSAQKEDVKDQAKDHFFPWAAALESASPAAPASRLTAWGCCSLGSTFPISALLLPHLPDNRHPLWSQKNTHLHREGSLFRCT